MLQWNLEEPQRNKYKQEETSSLANIGFVYMDKGESDQALEHLKVTHNISYL